MLSTWQHHVNHWCQDVYAKKFFSCRLFRVQFRLTLLSDHNLSQRVVGITGWSMIGFRLRSLFALLRSVKVTISSSLIEFWLKQRVVSPAYWSGLGVVMSQHNWHTAKGAADWVWSLEGPISKPPIVRLHVWNLYGSLSSIKIPLIHWSGSPLIPMYSSTDRVAATILIVTTVLIHFGNLHICFSMSKPNVNIALKIIVWIVITHIQFPKCLINHDLFNFACYCQFIGQNITRV